MTHYRVNSPNVIHEVIDGEAVLVNLENGSYYSIDKVGADIWSLIERSTPVSQIIEAIDQQYEGDREAIEEGVNQLITELQQEALIVPDQANNGSSPAIELDSAADNGEKPSFEPPMLHKYTDMEDLLLLDPIHEVDETGWPNTAPNEVHDA